MLTGLRRIQTLGSGFSTGGRALLVGALLCAPRLARADVASCTQLHASGQREVKAGRLRLASELFASCGSTEGCPEAIKAECVDFYGVVDKTIPTVVFTVTDEQGKDITNVKVYSTDQLVVESLDGRPVPLDPGKHRFRFVLPWGEVLSSDILVREGEKHRVVGVQVKEGPSAKPSQAPAAPLPTAAAPVSPAPALSVATRRSLPVGFWVASGVGAASLVSWGVFAVLGQGKQSALEDCSPTCDSSQHDDFDAMKRNYLIADISLGAAAVSAGIATWLFFSADRKAAVNLQGYRLEPPRFAILPLPGGAGAALVVNAGAL